MNYDSLQFLLPTIKRNFQTKINSGANPGINTIIQRVFSFAYVNLAKKEQLPH